MSTQAATLAKTDSRADPFDSWATNLIGRGDLSDQSARKYRTLWNAWRGWLLQLGQDWRSADAALIGKFLRGPAPGQGGRRKAINPAQMSSYTRQRYWRLLRGVYATAVKDDAIPNNPALDVPEGLRPTISSRDRQSQVLEPYIFKSLRDPQTIEAIVPVKTTADWWHLRDRAILSLLVATGITTSELIALRGIDLARADRRPLDSTQNQLLEGESASLVLDVMASHDTVERTLVITESITPVLLEWMRVRHDLLVERAARSCPPAQRHEFLKTHASGGPLFVARRARAATSVLPPMEAVSVYYTVSQAFNRLRGENTATSVAKGPAVIRNSVIRHWLDTVGPQETVKRAGLKNIESLRLKADRKETPS